MRADAPPQPAFSTATIPLRRDDDGTWTDAALVIKALQLVDPLIVKAIVEPIASKQARSHPIPLTRRRSSANGDAGYITRVMAS